MVDRIVWIAVVREKKPGDAFKQFAANNFIVGEHL